MKSPRYFGKPRRPKLIIRQVIGRSMLPHLKPGQLIIASKHFKDLKPHDLVVIYHDNVEKIKRLVEVKDNKVYVLGDNENESIDSRTFGWVEYEQVVAKVIWPRNH